MAGLPGLDRRPQADETGEQEASFAWSASPAAGESGGFEFRFETPPTDTEENPGRADFPFEITPLELRVGYLERTEDADAAMEAAAQVSRELGLLVLDPQSGQEIPVPPDAESLRRSYAAHRADVADSLAYLRQFRRKLLVRSLLIFLAALVLSLLIHAFRG
jgi:hypothetical protein